MGKEKGKSAPKEVKPAPKPQPKLKLVKNPMSFDLVIPEEVEAKIRHLCSKVHDVEWSGTLFYVVEGSLDDGTFKATCVDVYVRDIGTAGATVFKDTEDIIAYRLEHRETLLRPGVYEALIHSHNNMNAFFSGIDDDTLIAEGTDLNHFLSLVVCNAGQYVARITRKLRTIIKAEAQITYTKTVEYNSYENERKVVSEGETWNTTKQDEREEVVVEYFELNIDKAYVEEPFKEIDEKLDEIKRSKYRSYAYSGGQYFQGGGYRTTGILDAQGKPYTLPTEKKEEPKTEPKDPKQLTIFGQEEVKNEQKMIPQAIPADDDDEFIEFYMVEKVPYSIIRTLCTQLLCGSILVSQRTTINLNDWVTKMDKLYRERFGDISEGTFENLRLRDWINQFLEHLIGYPVDKEYEDKIAAKYLDDDYDYSDSDAFIHLYACDMITFLEDLPKSEVKEMMIDALTTLMPADYGDNSDN